MRYYWNVNQQRWLPASNGLGSTGLGQVAACPSVIPWLVIGAASWAFFGQTILETLGLTRRAASAGVQALGRRLPAER